MDPIAEQTMSAEEFQQYLYLEPLIRGVFNNYRMDRMMEILEKTLGHPALIIDMGFKIIDETPSITDDYRLYVRNDIFLVESCIDLIKANHIFKNMANRSYSSVLIPHPHFHSFIVASLKTSGADTLMLIVFENGAAFEPLDYDLIKKVSQILAVQYQKADITFNSDRMVLPNHIVFSLLNGETVTREELIEKINYVPWTRQTRLYFMLIDDKDDHIDIRPRFLSILPALRTFLPAEYCLTYRSFIISFLGPEQFDALYRKYRSEFEQFLDANHLCCVISPEYSDILDSRAYYFSVQNLLRMARRHHLTLACFQDMHFYIVYDLISAKYPLDFFIHPAVKLLQDYDEKNDSNLLETLDIYLANKSDPEMASALLYIHRSTLFYRVKKIRELTGYNLENLDEASEIYFSLQMCKIDRKYKEL